MPVPEDSGEVFGKMSVKVFGRSVKRWAKLRWPLRTRTGLSPNASKVVRLEIVSTGEPVKNLSLQQPAVISYGGQHRTDYVGEIY